MKHSFCFFVVLAGLACGAVSACAQQEELAASSEESGSVSSDSLQSGSFENSTDETNSALSEPRPTESDFQALLDDYQLMNERLERVSARLRLDNTALCPKTFRDPGFSVHALEDYAPRLQLVAQSLMGLSPEGLYIRAVRRGSPADQGDIEAGDRLLKLNGQLIPNGPTMKRFYGALSRGAFGGIKTKLTLQTPDGVNYDTSLRSETACDYPTSVFYSDEVNGHTNGDEVFITSELMRIVADDVNLALIVAHEMAHAIAGHMDQAPSQVLELEADRMALIMLERAGYNIEDAITYWADAVHPHRNIQDNSASHPTIQARYENFRKEQARIETLKAARKPLRFSQK